MVVVNCATTGKYVHVGDVRRVYMMSKTRQSRCDGPVWLQQQGQEFVTGVNRGLEAAGTQMEKGRK